ncbi:hypothetical protein [Pseudoalteromonas spongiae]|uniref:hypothetical protein n=1 Tax=Pseudoalteromonas spongiae TaxID=298657 RepID=UPI000C2D11CC|nr:hypothetical protein [Pseudoalteromonas spongiae]
MQRNHLKIFKSESLEQHVDAGGHRTNNEVVNGKLNDVFRSITEVDYAQSAFEVVKLFPSVATHDATRLADSHVYLSEKPQDPLVNTLLIESPSLADDTKMATMRNLITSSTAKYHGMSVLTNAVESGALDLIVETTQTQVLPQVTTANDKLNVQAYAFSPNSSTTYNKTRVKTFVAPSSSNAAIFNINVDDYFEYLPDFTVKYLSVNGWRTLKPYENNAHFDEVKYQNNQFVFTLSAVYPMRAGTTLEVTYHSNKDYRKHSFATTPTLTLAPGEKIQPNTFRVKKAGEDGAVYTDKNGIFIDNTGNVFAQVNHDTGEITPSNAVDLNGTVNDDLGCIVLVATTESQAYPTNISFSVESDEYRVDSLRLVITRANGTTFSVGANASGVISHAEINGTLENGYVTLTASVDVANIAYDLTVIEKTAIDAPWLGINASALPNGGNVYIFNENRLVCIQNRNRTEKTSLTNGQTINSIVDADYVDITDSTGASLYDSNDANYSYDKPSGVITINTGISGFTAPFIITAVQFELRLVTQVEPNKLRLLSPVLRNYPQGAVVSSVTMLGDLQALALDERTQSAWSNNFGQKSAAGSSSLNLQQYPIEMNNLGAINQRWALVWGTNNTFVLFGESVGEIGSGDVLNDFAPINPITQQPFMIIRKEALGSGLQPGECLLFETTAAGNPIMVSRCISPGHSNIEFDSTTLSFKGYA